MDTNDTISTFNGLIEACRDGQNGFQEAMTNIRFVFLKSLFAEASTERAKFLGELQEEVRSLGGDPAKARARSREQFTAPGSM